MRSWEKHNLDGEEFLRQHRPHDARTSFDLAVAQARHFGDRDIRLGVSLANLGGACAQDRDLNSARANYRESVSVLERARQSASTPFEERLSDEELARALGGFAGICLAQNNLDEAAQHYERSLEIYKSLKGGSSNQEVGFITYEVVRVLAGLADASLGKADYRRAEKIYMDALKMAEGLPGHAEIRRQLSLNLAKVFRRTGRMSEANTLLSQGELNSAQKRWLPLMQRARSAYLHGDLGEAEALYSQALGEAEQMQDIDGYASTLRGQALVYLAQGRMSEAKTACARALELLEDANSLVDDEIDRQLRTLTRILLIQEAYQEAEPLLQKRLAIEKRVYRENSVQTAETLALLAYVGRKLGRDNLEEYATQAEEIAVKFPNRPRISAALLWLGKYYQDKGQLGYAENAYKRALEIRRVRNIAGRMADVLLAMGKLYAQMGRADDARTSFEEALADIGTTNGARGDATAFDVQLSYAEFLVSRKDFDRAEKLYAGATAMVGELPEISHSQKRKCVDAFLQVLTTNGKTAEAAEVKRQFETIY